MNLLIIYLIKKFKLSSRRKSVRSSIKKIDVSEILLIMQLKMLFNLRVRVIVNLIIDDKSLLEKIKLTLGIINFEQGIHVIAVFIENLSSISFERARHLINIDSSLAVMSIIYALEVQGVSSWMIKWTDMK